MTKNNSKGFAHLVLIVGVVLVGIVGVGYLIIKDSTNLTIIPDAYQQTGVDYWQCDQDSDCVVAINPDGCCYCPDSINKKYIGKDNWEIYLEGKTYQSSKNCGRVACEPCEAQGIPICYNNSCNFAVHKEGVSTSNQISDNNLTDWKTYRNEEYGFEFDYPSSLNLETLGPSSPRTCKSKMVPSCLVAKNLVVVQLTDPNKTRMQNPAGYVMSFSIVENDLDQSVLERIELEAKFNMANPTVKEHQISEELKGYSYEELVYGASIIFWSNLKSNSENFLLLDWYRNNDVVQQILSTFKFLE